MFWCIMKDIHEELRGKHFDEVYATYQVDNMYHTDNKVIKLLLQCLLQLTLENYMIRNLNL